MPFWGVAFGHPRLTKTNICRGGVSPSRLFGIYALFAVGRGRHPPPFVKIKFHTAGAYGMPPYDGYPPYVRTNFFRRGGFYILPS